MRRVGALNEWADSIRVTYGVDPRIFIGLVVASIPPFYVAFAVAVRSAMRARSAGVPVLSERSFVISGLVLAGAWLLPYAYVAAVGDLPLWAWTAFAGFLCLGLARAALFWRRRTTLRSEAADE